MNNFNSFTPRTFLGLPILKFSGQDTDLSFNDGYSSKYTVIKHQRLKVGSHLSRLCIDLTDTAPTKVKSCGQRGKKIMQSTTLLKRRLDQCLDAKGPENPSCQYAGGALIYKLTT